MDVQLRLGWTSRYLDGPANAAGNGTVYLGASVLLHIAIDGNGERRARAAVALLFCVAPRCTPPGSTGETPLDGMYGHLLLFCASMSRQAWWWARYCRCRWTEVVICRLLLCDCGIRFCSQLAPVAQKTAALRLAKQRWRKRRGHGALAQPCGVWRLRAAWRGLSCAVAFAVLRRWALQSMDENEESRISEKRREEFCAFALGRTGIAGKEGLHGY